MTDEVVDEGVSPVSSTSALGGGGGGRSSGRKKLRNKSLKGSMARESSQSSIHVIVNSSGNSCDEEAHTKLDREASTESLLPEKEERQIELRKDGKGLGITVAGYICEKGESIHLLIFLLSYLKTTDFKKSLIM